MLGESRLLLIQVNRYELKLNRRIFLQIHKDVQHRVGIFAPREAYHNSIAFLNHTVICYGFTDIAPQTFLQFVRL